jgi:porin
MGSERGITIFGAAVFGLGSNQPADYDITFGAVYVGPFAARPKDSVGIAVGDTHYNGAYLNQLYNYRVGALGGSQRPQSSLIMGEIHYDVVLNRWFDMMPNMQYIVHPDGLGTMPYPKSNLPDAFVIGLQFKADLTALAGLTPGN